MAGLRMWACRHPVLSIFLLAIVVRLVAAIALTAIVGMQQFPDTAGYDRLASQGFSSIQEDEGVAGYVLPLVLLYQLFGNHLFLGQLLAAAMGALTAALVCRLILEVSTIRWALFGGLIVALFPSQVLWSSVAFKDSAVWLATAGMALVVAWASRAQAWRLAASGVVLAGLLFWLGHLRKPTFITASWVLVAAAVLSTPRGRLLRVAGAVAISAIIPWFLGTGAFGVANLSSYSAADIRVRNAEGADTAFVGEGKENDLLYLPRGLSVVLLEPLPWTSFAGYEIRLAQAELVLWYPLLIVGAVGVPSAVRRRRELAFPVCMTGAMVVIFSLVEGNFGTALRHRSELVPGLATLAALGAPVFLDWRRRRTARTQPEAAGATANSTGRRDQ